MTTKTTKTITCPKCGKEGRESVWKFKAKGHVYYYRVVVHPDGKKCILGRAEPPKPAKTGVLVDQNTVAELEKLRAENEELRRRVEELEKERAQAEARANLVMQVFASSLWVGPRELEALRAMYIMKRGYTEEQREVAKNIMHALVERGMATGQAVICFPPPGFQLG